MGVCGGNAYTTKFLEWFRRECPPDSLLDVDEDDDEKSFLAMALDSKGLWLYTNLCEPDKLHDNYYAIGSGAQAACEAMRRGDTPAQAVKAAMRWDEGTGGKVTELHLMEKHKEPKQKPVDKERHIFKKKKKEALEEAEKREAKDQEQTTNESIGT